MRFVDFYKQKYYEVYHDEYQQWLDDGLDVLNISDALETTVPQYIKMQEQGTNIASAVYYAISNKLLNVLNNNSNNIDNDDIRVAREYIRKFADAVSNAIDVEVNSNWIMPWLILKSTAKAIQPVPPIYLSWELPPPSGSSPAGTGLPLPNANLLYNILYQNLLTLATHGISQILPNDDNQHIYKSITIFAAALQNYVAYLYTQSLMTGPPPEYRPI